MTVSEKHLNHKIELLAPAGNPEALIAAVQGGCDAVYLGIRNYSARAFAGNFDHDEFIEAVKYCHVRGVRVYVTMNTLLFEEEIERAMEEVAFLYEHDTDALLIQDFGLFHRVRTEYPDFEVHCSTQMHVHNADGCRIMKQEGAARAVLARETPIEVIRECAKIGIEIEVFAYGALCVAYSGQCLMSESVKNRSGNRGVCAQMCRLRFYENDGEARCPSPEGEYALAMKDLNLINDIPALIEAGASSLKIEGRMKRREYVYLVTRTFREAIDAYYSGKTYRIPAEREKELELLFNRGFTRGHAFHDTQKQRMTRFRPNHMGVKIGTVVSFSNNKVTVDLIDHLYQHDGLRILNSPADTGLTAVRIEKKGKLVNEALPGDRVILDCASKPHPKKGQILLKTTDTHLHERIDRAIEEDTRKVPITVSCSAEAGKPLLLTAEDDDHNQVSVTSEQILEPARKAPLSAERITQILCKTGEEPYAPDVTIEHLDDIFIPVSALNEVRRTLYQKLSEARAKRHTRAGRKPYVMNVPCISCTFPPVLIDSSDDETKNTDFMKLPVISENGCDKILHNRVILSEPGNLWPDVRHAVAGMTLNVTNSYAVAWLLSHPGVEGVILSSELRTPQIRSLIDAFVSRYGFEPMLYQLVYGRRTLMWIKDYHLAHPYLEDLQKRCYPVMDRGFVTEILEPEPYVSENSLCRGSYVILTTEDRNQSEAIKEEAYEEISGRVQGIRAQR